MLRYRLRFLALALPLLAVAAACGGRTITRTSAEKLLVSLPSGTLDNEDVKVLSVSQVSSGAAIVETTVRTAFRVERIKGDWVVREVRVGNRQWESIDSLLAALNSVKAEHARQILGVISSALERYREKYGRLPTFNDYVALSDALYPDYMADAYRLDPWRQPWRAFRETGDTVRLVSAGPDEKPDTPDDIVLVKAYPP
jgi:hypothetical protein